MDSDSLLVSEEILREMFDRAFAKLDKTIPMSNIPEQDINDAFKTLYKTRVYGLNLDDYAFAPYVYVVLANFNPSNESMTIEEFIEYVIDETITNIGIE